MRKKRYFFIVLSILILFPFCVQSDAEDRPVSYRFALVLSGGGSRGLAQIGVLKALDEAQLKPDLIVGTSMGAIVGALYSAGYSPDSILAIATSLDWPSIFSNTAQRSSMFVSQKTEPADYLFEVRLTDRLEPIPPNSISSGQSFYNLLSPLLANAIFRAQGDFDRLPIPIRVVTTDLLTGERVVLKNGNLTQAVRASCGIPLAFSPVSLNGRMLMDGGLAANIPVETAREEQPAIVLAIDVTSPLWKQSNLDNPVRLMDQVVGIGERHQKEASRARADLVVTPEIEGFLNTDFSRIDTLVSRGYTSMLGALDSLRTLLSPPETPLLPTSGETDSFTRPSIAGIAVSGNNKTLGRLIEKAAGVRAEDTLSPALVRKAITSVYATGLFSNVNVALDSTRRLQIMVDEKRYWRVRAGLRYDEFHLGEGYLQPAYENLFGRGICALAHLQYGLRREKYAFELQGNHLIAGNFANYGKFQTYLSTERLFLYDTTYVVNPVDSTIDTTPWLAEKFLRKGGMFGLAGIQLGKTTMLSTGLHLEFYKVQSGSSGIFNSLWGLQFLPYLLLRLSMDSMDDYPFPRSGYRSHITLGATDRRLAAKDDFLKCDGSAGRYLTFGKKHTVFPQVRFAWSSDSLPPVEQTYIGGMIPEERYKDLDLYNSVPYIGMPARKLRGDVMALCHLDYRLRVNRTVYLSAIMDWGYVWRRTEFSWTTAWSDLAQSAPLGLGAGIAVKTFVGPLRCTYGRLLFGSKQLGILSDNQFYFSLGHDF